MKPALSLREFLELYNISFTVDQFRCAVSKAHLRVNGQVGEVSLQSRGTQVEIMSSEMLRVIFIGPTASLICFRHVSNPKWVVGE